MRCRPSQLGSSLYTSAVASFPSPRQSGSSPIHGLVSRTGRNRARRLAPARFHRLRRGAVPSIIPGRGDVRGNMPPLLASRTGRSRGDRTTRNWRRSSSSVLFRGAHPILRETKKAPQKRGLKNALALFYFPTQIYAVSSTMEGLTAEFGMGSGVPPPP